MKKILLIAIGIISILAIMNSASAIETSSAIEISSFDADYAILGVQTRTIYTIHFMIDNADNLNNGFDNQDNFSIDLPLDSQINSISVNDFFVNHAEKRKDTKQTISFNINSSGKIVVDYTTESYVDSGTRNYFISDIRSNYPIASIHSRVVLPVNSFLSESEEQGGSVFPQGNVATDGKTIYVEWKKDDLQPGNSFPMLVIYRTMKGTSFLIYVLTLVILGIMAYFGFPYLVKRHVKNLQDNEKEAYSKEFDKSSGSNKSGAMPVNPASEDKLNEKQKDLQKILAHLTEDEQQIVNILADREGHIEQGTLVIITGFSKAHLSRLLDELQRRRIIHKEKKGKKNVVWLKSQF